MEPLSSELISSPIGDLYFQLVCEKNGLVEIWSHVLVVYSSTWLMPVLASGVPSYGALCQDVCVAWFESGWVGDPPLCVLAAAPDSQAGIVSLWWHLMLYFVQHFSWVDGWLSGRVSDWKIFMCSRGHSCGSLTLRIDWLALALDIPRLWSKPWGASEQTRSFWNDLIQHGIFWIFFGQECFLLTMH